ncbi:hypothetical protein [Streptomyces melanogenes]|uniref:hypothetical protein n=1 Tax=Streptomyces melanogenes TaxID=67326 RepID=UPI00167E4521|nr:hypothetical protein [Streptomyces melanogenes]
MKFSFPEANDMEFRGNFWGAQLEDMPDARRLAFKSKGGWTVEDGNLHALAAISIFEMAGLDQFFRNPLIDGF